MFGLLVLSLIQTLLFTPLQQDLLNSEVYIEAYSRIKTYIADGQSMHPTIHDRDHLLVHRHYYYKQLVKRNDIVIFQANEEQMYVKRVVGLPHETIRHKKGRLLINEKPIRYPFKGLQDFEPVTLKDDEYFVIGDNVTDSLDSRIIGPIKHKQLVGKVMQVMSIEEYEALEKDRNAYVTNMKRILGKDYPGDYNRKPNIASRGFY
ncbi:signal peptidase I [Brevibacillus daliensis]|uniref:signal peptidase I n=1 Tax=Brevibacillus daliensis TaxID=2892995 RepID=UPI001E37E90F|nr:signal peptidase I [Brevibacillus daliensis]